MCFDNLHDHNNNHANVILDSYQFWKMIRLRYVTLGQASQIRLVVRLGQVRLKAHTTLPNYLKNFKQLFPVLLHSRHSQLPWRQPRAEPAHPLPDRGSGHPVLLPVGHVLAQLHVLRHLEHLQTTQNQVSCFQIRPVIVFS